MTSSISRRDFLKLSGLTTALYLTSNGLLLNACHPATNTAHTAATSSNSADKPVLIAWMNVNPDDTVTAILGKAEMGQGIFNSLGMLIADEMEADWDRMIIQPAPARQPYFDPHSKEQVTVNSGSVRHLYTYLRLAAAATRERLISVAAQNWNVPRTICRASVNKVYNSLDKRSFTYGELCEAAAKMPFPPSSEIPLKKPEQFRLIGTAQTRRDILPKLAGAAQFGMDHFPKEMCYALVERPPVLGSKILTMDAEAALRLPGVHEIFKFTLRDKRFPGERVAICGDSVASVAGGKAALVLQWDAGNYPTLDNAGIYKIMDNALSKPGIPVLERGTVSPASAQQIQATITTPFTHQATIEPPTCTTTVGPDRCDIWAPTQIQTRNLTNAGEITGLKPEQIFIHSTFVGGGFGRKSYGDFVDESVTIAKISGKPVKLLWTREDDIAHGVYNSSSSASLKASVNNSGGIASWEQKVVSNPIRFDDDGLDLSALCEGVVYGDSNKKPTMLYKTPNAHVSYVTADLKFPVGYMRSVSLWHNLFAVETIIDELAFKAGSDPLKFRLDNLNPEQFKRAAPLLEKVAAMSGWHEKRKPDRGLGIAQYYFARYPGTYLAQAAEVSVDKDGAIRVHNIWSAVDCGQTVDIGQVAAQVEGGSIMGLSMALKEALLLEAGGVAAKNFRQYPILRMNECPEVFTHVVENHLTPGGIGDASPPLIAPAMANAVFDLVYRSSGKQVRIRDLPMTPETVKKTIASA